MYSSDEFDVILADVCAARQAGAAGVVLGMLTAGGDVDVERMRVVRRLCAPPMLLTFHRAFDVCRDYKTALDQVSCLALTITWSG